MTTKDYQGKYILEVSKELRHIINNKTIIVWAETMNLLDKYYGSKSNLSRVSFPAYIDPSDSLLHFCLVEGYWCWGSASVTKAIRTFDPYMIIRINSYEDLLVFFEISDYLYSMDDLLMI